jgi:hypothetical protein
MKTRLVNGLVLGFLFATSSACPQAWAQAEHNRKDDGGNFDGVLGVGELGFGKLRLTLNVAGSAWNGFHAWLLSRLLVNPFQHSTTPLPGPPFLRQCMQVFSLQIHPCSNCLGPFPDQTLLKRHHHRKGYRQ